MLLFEKTRIYLETIKKSLYVFSFQGLAFLLTTLSNFLIINHFDKQSYAILTIFLSTIGTSNVLSDSGITSAYRRLAGIHWESKNHFSVLVQSLFSLRKEIIAIITPVTICFATYLFMKEFGGWKVALLLPIILLTIFVFLEVGRGIYIEILRSQMKIKEVQSAENIQNVLRLFLVIGVIYLTNKNINLLLLTYVLTSILTLIFLRNKAAQIYTNNTGPKKAYIKVMRIKYFQLLPNSMFYVVQSQITFFILATFNQPNAIANFGALSKIGLVFNLLNAVVLNVFSVKFSRTSQLPSLKKHFYLFTVFAVGVSIFLVLMVYLSKSWLIKLFGSQYLTSENLLPLFMVYSSIAFIFGGIYTMNTAKSWVKLNARYAIPVSIGCIIAGVAFLDLRNIDQVVIFSILPILLTGLLKIADTLNGLKLIKL